VAKIIRHNVIKYLTDRPGEVVYRDFIVENGGFTASQVRESIRAVQQSQTQLGKEIETVVAGNAWRFVPSVQQSTPASTIMTTDNNLGVPLTQLIRRYLTDRPNVDVDLDELIDFTGRTEAQVKVGVNNVRNAHIEMRQTIVIVESGRCWRYEPARRRQSSRTPVPIRAIRAPRPVPPPPPSPVTQPTTNSVAVSAADLTEPVDSPRLFEEVGSLDDDSFVIRGDEGDLYRATPLRG
jgi:hypothetical protein